MVEQFVSYEIALKLKELGFDEKCLTTFNEKGKLCSVWNINMEDYDDIYIKFMEDVPTTFYCEAYDIDPDYTIAPLYQQVIDWFREKHNIIITWNLHDGDNPNSWRITISRFDCYDLLYNQNVGREPYYKRYEEAREQAILKTIEIINGRNIYK